MSAQAQKEKIEKARGMIALYTTAETEVLAGKSFSILGQSVSYEDLDKIRAGRQEWEKKLKMYLGGDRRYGRIIPRIW